MEELEDESIEHLATRYFSFGFQQKEIIQFLKLLHKKFISSRTLRRILSKHNLYRRKNYSRIENVVDFIESEIKKSGQLHGYRWMHLKCLQNNLIVTQEVVRELLWLLDPEGMKIRKRKRLRRRQYNNKGPNYLWHMDSYDKLKPYGICINGCIDGFSRHIIWLRVGKTSSDPKVIGGYFLDAVKMVGGCPKTIRADMGTENKCVEELQKMLHELFDDSESERPPFMYGKSTHNQRIEAWWSILRKHNSQFWMNSFQKLKDDNLFDGSFLDKSLMQFCFIKLIQKELGHIVLEWNVHKISGSRNSVSPSGRPSILYEMPTLYDADNYLIQVPSFALDTLSEECIYNSDPCDKDFSELCNILMSENGLSHDENDPHAMVELYMNLRSLLYELF